MQYFSYWRLRCLLFDVVRSCDVDVGPIAMCPRRMPGSGYGVAAGLLPALLFGGVLVSHMGHMGSSHWNAHLPSWHGYHGSLLVGLSCRMGLSIAWPWAPGWAMKLQPLCAASSCDPYPLPPSICRALVAVLCSSTLEPSRRTSPSRTSLRTRLPPILSPRPRRLPTSRPPLWLSPSAALGGSQPHSHKCIYA